MTVGDAMDSLVTPRETTAANGDEPEPESGAAAPGSVLAVLRARAKELREQQTVTLDVPGYDGYMACRFKAVSLGRVFSKRNDATTAINPDWTMAADTLGTAVLDVLMRDDPEGDTLYPIFKDQPARFDDDLVAALDLQPEGRTARAVLVALCGGGAFGESRVWAYYMQYQGWLIAGVEGEPAEVAANAQAVGELAPR
jgi:hypothetical protein